MPIGPSSQRTAIGFAETQIPARAVLLKGDAFLP
jgi:hypothetical protein